MYAPARDDELTGLANYADQQLEAIYASAYGLTEAQARETPCRSALSISGIVKHVGYGMRGAIDRLSRPIDERPMDDAAFAEYMGSFALTEDETTAEELARFATTRADFLAAVRAADPDAETIEPPAPWYGAMEPAAINTRYYLVHLVEEYARHAGHADIIREQVDGQFVPALVMAVAGVPANDFFTPLQPEPGTLLAVN